MPEVQFPPYVEDFIRLTGEYLKEFELSLELQEEQVTSQSRTYTVEASDGSVEVIAHRTSGSMNQDKGEYRIRVNARVAPEFKEHAKDIENFINRVATLGALVDEATAVTCQCLVPEHDPYTTAGLLALAIAHGRRSLITSHAKALMKDKGGAVEQLSAWSDLDFELADYDHAHLGRGTRHQRGWQMKFFEGAVLSLDAVHNNPYWSGGLLSLLRMPKASVAGEDAAIDAAGLNMWGYLIGRAPTFGAWCELGDNFIFAQFFPNFVKELPDLTDQIIRWATVRCQEVQGFAELQRQMMLEAKEAEQ